MNYDLCDEDGTILSTVEKHDGDAMAVPAGIYPTLAVPDDSPEPRPVAASTLRKVQAYQWAAAKGSTDE